MVAADESVFERSKRGSTGGPALHEYLIKHSVHSNAALDKLQQTSPPDSIAILQLLLKLTQAKVAVEVGVFTGYTSLGIALGLPADGKLYSLDITDEYPSIGKPFWKEAGVADKIHLEIGPAAESLQKLLQTLGPNSVDLGFIDADKDNYDVYYEALLKLVRPGGVIVVDNVLWGGAVLDDSDQTDDTKAIRALNSKIYNDKRVQIAMLKNSDGITVAYKL